MVDELLRAGWLGRGTPIAPAGVRVTATAPGRIRLVADRDLEGFAGERFSRPKAGVRWAATDWPADAEFLGFGCTQFALPVTAGVDLAFDFRPHDGLRSPRAVVPLIARSNGHVVLLAPVDHPHEQIIAVGDGELTWGWHGDLDTVPEGFSTTLGVYEASTVDDVVRQWSADLSPVDRSRSNELLTHLSYWTDNGAAYWYRTEPGRTIVESVEEKIAELRGDGIGVRAVELDSWWYPHATPRSITEIGYPEEVPPTGAITWTPRSDAFSADAAVDGADPLAALRQRLGATLVLHARHVAPTSPYVRNGWWIDQTAAHPEDPEFFRRWFEDAARWGATCIEQDWMLASWFGVRALRSGPGRAAHWQRTLNELAEEVDVDLLWCMATPADLILAASLDRVAAVRTSDDYRFADDPAFLWVWFLVVNRLADALGLTVFKDCFFSEPDLPVGSDDIDGDRHAELEAALSALSCGPVGIGDRLGRTNREIVLRTCDADGRLRRLDGAIAAIDDCLFGDPAVGRRLMWATTTATTSDGVWTYLLAIHVGAAGATICDGCDLDGERTVYEWRRGTTVIADRIEVELGHRDWALFVVGPVGAPSAAEVGDVTKYVVVETTSPPPQR